MCVCACARASACACAYACASVRKYVCMCMCVCVCVCLCVIVCFIVGDLHVEEAWHCRSNHNALIRNSWNSRHNTILCSTSGQEQQTRSAKQRRLRTTTAATLGYIARTRNTHTLSLDVCREEGRGAFRLRCMRTHCNYIS